MSGKRAITPNQWILSGDTGVSSRTIWAVMMGETQASLTGAAKISGCYFDVPHDPDDFGRCYRLLAHFPEWRGRIAEMGEIFPAWKPMADRWDEMESLYLQESPSGRCPRLYELMSELVEEGMLLDGWRRAGSGCWTRKTAQEGTGKAA